MADTQCFNYSDLTFLKKEFVFTAHHSKSRGCREVFHNILGGEGGNKMLVE